MGVGFLLSPDRLGSQRLWIIQLGGNGSGYGTGGLKLLRTVLDSLSPPPTVGTSFTTYFGFRPLIIQTAPDKCGYGSAALYRGM